MTTTRIPADVEREDRVLAGLTARQLAILAVTAVVVWLVVTAGRSVVPVPLLTVAVVPVGALGATLALGRRDGLSGDRFARAAVAYRLTPRRRVLAPEGVAPLPAWVRPAAPPEVVAPLDLPARDIRDSGVLDLGDEGSAIVARASPVNFSLRSEAEQEALVAAFGRFLHALGTPVQVIARAERADLSPMVAELHEAAKTLPDPRLRDAAAEHAEFLASLGARRDLLRRETLVVFRHPAAPPDAEDALVRGIEEAAALLQSSGVALCRLDGNDAGASLRRCADPETGSCQKGRALPGEPVRGPA